MDDDGLNMRNWGYYEPSFKEHLGLQLMSPMTDQRDTKPYLLSRENPLLMNPNPPTYHQPPPPPMQYMRDGWIQRERLLHMFPGNPNFPVIPNTSIPILPPPDACSGEGSGGSSGAPEKKRTTSTTTATPRAKRPKKTPSTPKQQTGRAKTVKRNMDVVINGIDMDISGIPIPVCSCTGASQQCYRWGSGGWQSACCTTTISMYPLPMSTKRRGARIAGRKMSQGAFKKVLTKLASEGYNFANAIDLKTYWAKHGTNKFVTIR